MWIAARYCAAVSLILAFCLKIDIIGLMRLIVALRPKFGVFKATMFACVMRFSWMSAWPAAMQAFEGIAAVREDDHYAFAASGSEVGLLFLPGALVQAEAYAPVLHAVADASGATVVCALLPFRHPVLFGAEDAQRIMGRYPAVTSWVIAGHSMGAGKFGAAGLVQTNLRTNLSGLILWGGTLSGGLDLSGEAGLPCLALLASEDTVVPPDGKAEDGSLVLDGVTKRCPPNAQHVILKGGNHAGFAHYGPQRFPFPDGERKISLEDQQAQAVRHTARFLRERVLPR
jgi:hypothetical protein